MTHDGQFWTNFSVLTDFIARIIIKRDKKERLLDNDLEIKMIVINNRILNNITEASQIYIHLLAALNKGSSCKKKTIFSLFNASITLEFNI